MWAKGKCFLVYPKFADSCNKVKFSTFDGSLYMSYLRWCLWNINTKRVSMWRQIKSMDLCCQNLYLFWEKGIFNNNECMEMFPAILLVANISLWLKFANFSSLQISVQHLYVQSKMLLANEVSTTLCRLFLFLCFPLKSPEHEQCRPRCLLKITKWQS